MLFQDNSRWSYTNCQLREVICQLRFPTILSINEKPPTDFQEAIRDAFPSYSTRQERPAFKLTAPDSSSPQLEQAPPVNNHAFISSTGIWKINLTQNFIAVSTLRYQSWEDLAQRLDRPLAEFIRIYNPSYFERIGLRYFNAFSRKSLGLEGTDWRDLVSPAYLGVLSDPDVNEAMITRSSMETELNFSDGCHLKLQAGLGRLKRKNQLENEVRFLLDIDCSTSGQLSGNMVPERLSQLHDHASRAFRGAITDTIHTAMGANPV